MMETIHTGWLIKSPPEKKDQPSWKFFKSKWRRRFFVLARPHPVSSEESNRESDASTESTSKSAPVSETLMCYYDNEQRGHKYGFIDLVNCEEILSHLDSETFDYVFALKTLHKGRSRTYYLVTTTESEMNDWVERLCQVLQLAGEDGLGKNRSGVKRFTDRPKSSPGISTQKILYSDKQLQDMILERHLANIPGAMSRSANAIDKHAVHIPNWAPVANRREDSNSKWSPSENKRIGVSTSSAPLHRLSSCPLPSLAELLYQQTGKNTINEKYQTSQPWSQTKPRCPDTISLKSQTAQFPFSPISYSKDPPAFPSCSTSRLPALPSSHKTDDSPYSLPAKHANVCNENGIQARTTEEPDIVKASKHYDMPKMQYVRKEQHNGVLDIEPRKYTPEEDQPGHYDRPALRYRNKDERYPETILPTVFDNMELGGPSSHRPEADRLADADVGNHGYRSGDNPFKKIVYDVPSKIIHDVHAAGQQETTSGTSSTSDPVYSVVHKNRPVVSKTEPEGSADTNSKLDAAGVYSVVQKNRPVLPNDGIETPRCSGPSNDIDSTADENEAKFDYDVPRWSANNGVPIDQRISKQMTMTTD